MAIIRRTPRNYEGTAVTTHRMSELLPQVLGRIEEIYKDRPDLILAAWPEIIGPQLALHSRAVAFVKGTLQVKVNNSTLYHLFCHVEKPKLLRRLQERFPTADIQEIYFRMG